MIMRIPHRHFLVSSLVVVVVVVVVVAIPITKEKIISRASNFPVPVSPSTSSSAKDMLSANAIFLDDSTIAIHLGKNFGAPPLSPGGTGREREEYRIVRDIYLSSNELIVLFTS